MIRKGPKWPPNPRWPPKMMFLLFLCQLYESWVSNRFFHADLNEIWLQNKKWPEKVLYGRQIQDGRRKWCFYYFWANFMKFGYLIDFFKLNWMRYGYKTRNDQKGSKMAPKSKMAAENYDLIFFQHTFLC